MLEKIIKDINERISAQPNSLAATDDEVTICWLLTHIEELNSDINDLNHEVQGLNTELGDIYDAIEELPISIEEIL